MSPGSEQGGSPAGVAAVAARFFPLNGAPAQPIGSERGRELANQEPPVIVRYSRVAKMLPIFSL